MQEPETWTSSTPAASENFAAGSSDVNDEAVAEQLLELGWVLAGRFSPTEVTAMEAARDELLELLNERFPEFTWRMPFVRRPEIGRGSEVEPTLLLDEGVTEGSIRHWDFTFVLTNADLIGYYRRQPQAAVSRSLEAAVFSIVRMEDPRDGESERVRDESAITPRLVQLILHTLGHWAGLSHSDSPDNLMFEESDGEQLSPERQRFTEEQLDLMTIHLREVADRRLEEQDSFRTRQALPFYLAAMWINKGDLFRAVREARPWQFPLRLSRLTAAAASTTLIMLMTAEAWDLGMNQSWPIILTLSILAIMVTTAFILKKQRLIIPRSGRQLSEQSVLTNVATTLIVSLGMLSTYLVFYVASVLLSFLLFNQALKDAWTASIDASIRAGDHLVFAGFIALSGLVIGALGASFEQQYYFRHITLVDEEI